MQSQFDDGAPAGLHQYGESEWLRALDDDAIDAILTAPRPAPSPMDQVLLRQLGGASARHPVDAAAFRFRDAGSTSTSPKGGVVGARLRDRSLHNLVEHHLQGVSHDHVDGRGRVVDEAHRSLDDLVARFERPALNLARRILRDEGLAEDVVQEVFLAVWRRPGAFDPAKASFASWLMSMVHHKAVDVVRRERVRPRLPTDVEEHRAFVRDQVADAADEACLRDFRARVRAALSSLPLPQREVLVLAYFGGYTQSQIAARTGTPLGTVKTRSAAGMRTVREQLGFLAPSTPAPAAPSGAEPAVAGRIPVPRVPRTASPSAQHGPAVLVSVPPPGD